MRKSLYVTQGFVKKAFQKTAIFISLLAVCFASLFGPVSPVWAATTYTCDSVEQIQAAMKAALPGDTIIIAPGIYSGKKGASTSGSDKGHFYAGNSGTASAHIIMKSQDPANPAVLKGVAYNYGYVLYVTGDYWEFKDLKVEFGQKGIMVDNGNNNLIYNCEVGDIGDEAVHFRDGSNNNTIELSKVYDTGKNQPQYGEGIYVGSYYGAWGQYQKECDNNRIAHCMIGPGVTAEHIDIKEGTIGAIVEYCTFNGTGISGQNYADSFIDAKGNNAVIRYNTGYRNNNTYIVDAFQVHNVYDGWGLNNDFNHNTVYLDTAVPYVVNNAGGVATASDNERIPDGNMYYNVNLPVITPSPGLTPTPVCTVTPLVTTTPTPTPSPIHTATPAVTATPVTTATPEITATPVPAAGSIKVQLYNQSTTATTNQIYLNIKLENTTTSGITLSNVKIRYYYTIDGVKPQAFYCDYSPVGAGNVTGTFTAITALKTGADTYVEIGFTNAAGSLAAGGNTTIQARIAKNDWTDYTQTNDYSFNPLATNYVDWIKVTGYNSEVLQWGVEP
jgi:hypothetical protein